MNKDTFSQQKVVNKLKQNFLKDHKNINRRMQYLNEKKKLKTMLYQVKKAFLDKKLNKLGKLVYTSPRLFWSAIKISYSDTKQDKANCVRPRIWKQHFEKLLASRIVKLSRISAQ